MDSLGKRVAARRTELKLTQADLAKKSGMKQQGIQSIENDEVSRPRRLREIASALQTTEEWLLGETKKKSSSRAVIKQIPVLGDVAAGQWLEAETFAGFHEESPHESIPFPEIVLTDWTGIYALKVKGNSIDKIAPDGSFLICRSIAESGAAVEDDDLVVVERRRKQEGMYEVTVKRVKRTKTGFSLLPESNDPKYKPISYATRGSKDDDVEIRITAHVVIVAYSPVKKKK